MKPKNFIIDVDGVMTDGKFHYSNQKKIFKVFGADDNEGLKILSKYLNIYFITSDRRGYKISKRRITEDMNYDLFYINTKNRYSFVNKKFDLNISIFMADSFTDYYMLKNCFYSIVPKNADEDVKKISKYTTKRSGGDRAVSEACKHILKKFFNKNILDLIQK